MEDRRSVFGEVFGGVAVAAFITGAVYLWWTHEPPPKDPCQDLRDYFGKVLKADELREAVGQSVRVAVIDTPDAENGVPCGIALLPKDP